MCSNEDNIKNKAHDLNQNNICLEIKSEAQEVREDKTSFEIKTENFYTDLKSEKTFLEESCYLRTNSVDYSLTQENLGCSQESAQNNDKFYVKNEKCQDFSVDIQIGQAQAQIFSNQDSTKFCQLIEPEQFRKVFIGGLSYRTNEETFKTYFCKFGELVDHVVMKDKETGKSRGFGFVTYSNSSMVDELMRNRPHVIDGRQVEAKRATPREDSGRQEIQATVKKLYIGGMRDCLSEIDLDSYFSRYGTITDSIIMKDKETNKTRGFGFITFDDYDPVDKIILQRHHSINGIELKCEKAIPKENNIKKLRNNHNLSFQCGKNIGNNNNNFSNWSNRANVVDDFQMDGQFSHCTEFTLDQYDFNSQITCRVGGPIRNRHGHYTARFQGPYAGNVFFINKKKLMS